MGLWLGLFLIQHLFTNSQAAIWFGNDGNGFVRAVNAIQNLPYLYAIELLLIGVPFFIHMIWGIQYLWTGKFNSFRSDGASPSLTEYPKNHAYSWQRITSWILVFGVIAHVADMRFIHYPESEGVENQKYYSIKLSKDSGLEAMAARFHVQLEPDLSDSKKVIAKAPDFGTAELFIVRDTFKMPLMVILYSLFVIAATFHAFNGFWTFLITWGIAITERAQKLMKKMTVFLMFLITCFGLLAIWGTYLWT